MGNKGDKEPEKTDAAVDDLTKQLTSIGLKDQDENDDATDSTASEALQKFAAMIQKGKTNKILVVTGAGISVSAGIPDFRSPGTGTFWLHSWMDDAIIISFIYDD